MPKTKRALCVDDNPEHCLLLEIMLQPFDCAAIKAYGFGEALNLIETERFDLHILDKRLGDGCGLELCRATRARFPQAPIVFYTADAFPVHRAAGFAAGATEYVAKPNFEKLQTVVARLFA